MKKEVEEVKAAAYKTERMKEDAERAKEIAERIKEEVKKEARGGGRGVERLKKEAAEKAVLEKQVEDLKRLVADLLDNRR
nr:hypothetical protein [uncultured Faecalicatena sp.]